VAEDLRAGLDEEPVQVVVLNERIGVPVTTATGQASGDLS
jgi:hypothetical protein